MSKTQRQSGIELLRIIVMIQIIFLHAYQYGLLHNASKAAGDIDGTLVTFIWSFCRAPVDVFIMISGYFMITSQFDIKKTIRRSGKIYGLFFCSARSSTKCLRHSQKNITSTLWELFLW